MMGTPSIVEGVHYDGDTEHCGRVHYDGNTEHCGKVHLDLTKQNIYNLSGNIFVFKQFT